MLGNIDAGKGRAQGKIVHRWRKKNRLSLLQKRSLIIPGKLSL